MKASDWKDINVRPAVLSLPESAPLAPYPSFSLVRGGERLWGQGPLSRGGRSGLASPFCSCCLFHPALCCLHANMQSHQACRDGVVSRRQTAQGNVDGGVVAQ